MDFKNRPFVFHKRQVKQNYIFLTKEAKYCFKKLYHKDVAGKKAGCGAFWKKSNKNIKKQLVHFQVHNEGNKNLFNTLTKTLALSLYPIL